MSGPDPARISSAWCSNRIRVITRLRLEHHAALIAAGEPANNLIEPDELAPIAQTELREALGTVRRAQKRVAGWVPSG